MAANNFVASVGRWFMDKSKSTGTVALLFWHTFTNLPKVNIREAVKQMAKLGVDSLPIVIVTTTTAGAVFSVQTAQQFVKLGAGDTVGGIVTIAMGRELVPLLAGIVVAGRVGAAITAEIGSMKVTEQIDALRVMAISPIVYLVVPRFLACALMLPILAVFANVVGSWGAYFVANMYADITSYSYLHSVRTFCEPFDIVGGLIKCIVFGGIISVIGCHKGLTTVSGAEGVGVATTDSVVLSIILIFIANYFLSIILYV